MFVRKVGVFDVVELKVVSFDVFGLGTGLACI